MSTRGTVWIHSSPSALCPHVEWALGGVFGMPTHLDWTPQPVEPGSHRAELDWTGAPGTAARVASAFARWGRLRFEVAELPSQGHEGERYSVTPALGAFHARTDAHGDVVLGEDRLRQAMLRGEQGLAARLADLLGAPWDDELEAFRHAGDGAPVRWLHKVG